MVKRRTSRRRNALQSLFASLFGKASSDFTTLGELRKPHIEHLEERHLLSVAQLSIPDNLSGLVGSTVTVPIQMHVRELFGIDFTGGEAVFSYDTSKFTASNPRLASTFTSASFSSTFNIDTAGVAKFTTASPTGIHLDFTEEETPYDLFLVDLTITSGYGTTSKVNLEDTNTGLKTALFESGNQAITLDAAPTNANTDDVDGLITILNITMSTTGPYSVNEGSTVQLSGTASDSINGITTYEWDLDNDGIFGETGAAAAPRGNETGLTPTFSAVGQNGPAVPSPRSVKFRVVNGIGQSGVANTTVNIFNVPPTANAGGPYTVTEGGTVALSGTGTDPVDNLLNAFFLWDLDGDGSFGENGGAAGRGTETGRTPIFNAAGLTGGTTFSITMLVADGATSTFSATSVVVTSSNLAPVANVGGPYTINEGGSGTLSASGSTDDSTPVGSMTYNWDLDGDGVFGETGSVASRGNETGLTPTFNAASVNGPSSVTVTVRAIDSQGAQSTNTATALVNIANVAPSANAGGPYNVGEGQTTLLSGSVSDPVDSVTFDWDLDGDGVFGETNNGIRGAENVLNPTFVANLLDGPTTYTVTLRARDGVATTTSTALVNIDNVAPTASTGGPYTVNEGSTTSISGADATDVSGDVPNFTWDLDGDGIFSETGSNASRGNETGPAPNFSAVGFSGPTTSTITVRVTDGDGGTTTATGTVVVLNVAPTSLPGGAYTVAEGSSTTLTGSATDPVDTVTLAWDLDGDGIFGESGAAASRGNESGAMVSFSAAGLSGPATVTVTLRATDFDGLSSTATTSVVVTNVAPTANAGGPYTIAEGSSTTLNGSGTDPVDTVTFLWDLDGDTTFGETGGAGLFGNETGATPIFSASIISGPHTATVSLRVVDANGASTTSSTTVVVTNVAPTANAGGPYNVVEGGAASLSGTGTDPVDVVTFSWDLDNDGVFGETGAAASRGNETGANVTFDASALSAPATVTVTLRTRDGDGGSTTSTTTVTVNNSIPETDAGGPYSVAEGGSTTLSGIGFDAGGSVTLAWDLDNDGVFGETGAAASRGNETGVTPTYNAAAVSGLASITVTIRATDNVGTSVTDTALITVTNVAPTANAGGPYTVAEGSATGLLGNGTDPVDTPIFAWDLDGDGNFGETGAAASRGNETGASASFNAAGVSGPATVTVTLRVSDIDGASTLATSTVVVTNVAPTANTTGPYTLAEGSSTSVVGSGTDPVDTVTLQWDLDGDGVFGETGAAASRGNETGAAATFSAVGLSGPNTSTISFRVTDANGASTTATTAVVVTNVAPTANANGPYNAAEGGSTTLSGTGTDPVDTVTLLWDLDGDGNFGETGAAASRGNETGNSPVFSAAGLTGGATRTVSLRVNDGDGASVTTTAIVSINNQAPTASAGGPYSVAEGSSTSLLGTGSDAGGSVTLTWDLDGDGNFGETGAAASRGNETGNSPTFSATGLSGPATLTITVRATDSTGDSTTATTTMTVTNVTPTAIPGGPYTVVEGSATGLSGTGTDPVDTVTLSWDLDGDTIFGETGAAASRGNETGNTPSFSAAGLSGPATVTVTLKATDANGASSTATTTVVVTNAAPTANAGGPYNVAEGGSTTLSGTGTDAVDTVTLLWDLDGDGNFGETGAAASRGNETGSSPIFSAAGLTGGATRTVSLRVNDGDGASVTTTAIVSINNQAPTASAGGPYSVAEGSSTSLLGTGSDAGGSVTLTWDLDGDGNFGETGAAASRGNETGNSPTFSATGLSGPATLTITVRATDSTGDSTTATTTMAVTNVSPTAIPGGPYTVVEGSATGLSGTGTDPVDTVTVSWDLDGDTIFGETGAAASRGNETGNTPSFSAAGLSGPATVTVTLKATDANGASSTATTTVVVTNAVPTANAGGPYNVAEGSSTTLSGTGTDAVDAVVLAWDLDNDGNFGETGAAASRGNETGTNPSFSAAGLSGPATVTVTVRATDTDGASSIATTTVVVSNVAPTASAGGPYNVAEGGSTTLSGTGTDPVDAVTLLWDLDSDGIFGETGAVASRGNETGSSPTFNAAGLGGTATVTVTVRAIDANGASTTSTTTVSVANSPPTAEANGPYTVAEGSATTLSGTGADAGGSVVLSWDLDGDGTFGETGGAAARGNETGTSPSFNAAGLSGPTSRIVTLRVTDLSATSTFDTATVTITNVAPSANAGGPYSVAEGRTITLSGTGTDPIDTVTLAWDLDGDGSYGEVGSAAARGNETGANPVFNSANLNGLTTFRVSLKVTDADGAVVVSSIGSSTWQNSVNSYDVNNDSLVSAIDNLLLINSYASLTGSPLPTNPTPPAYVDIDGDGWLTENDKFLLQSYLNDNEFVPPTSGPSFGYVVVHNAAPTANAGGPYSVAEGSATTLSGTGTDPADGVVLTWDLDGDGTFGEMGGAAVRGNETGNNPSFNAPTLSGPATVTITVRATDDDGASASATTTVTVTNVPPTVNAGGPYTVAEAGTTGLSGTASDPVDSVAIAWDLDGDGNFGETGAGAIRGIETGTSPTYVATGLNGPTTATVTLRATDTNGASTTSTAAVVVTNVPPSAEANGPYTVTEGGATTLSGTGTDPVDSVVVTWDLDGDGTFGETGGAAGRGNETGNNPSFNAASVNGPTTVIVTVKVSDGVANTTDTALIVVNNAPPTANAGGPYTLAEGSSTTLSGVGTDPVDDVKLAWDLDGDGTFGETGGSADRGDETGSNPTFSAAGLSGPATLTVTVRATDCDLAVTIATTKIVVTNVPPTADAGGPYSVAEGGIAALSGTGSDPVDAVTLLWDLDGDGVFGETGSGAVRGNETGATPNYNSAGIAGPASIPVTLRVVDANGASATDLATIGIANVPPAAEAGGPYTVAEGGTRQLSGTGSDSAGSVVLSWDLDGDGTFGETGGAAGRGNETGTSPIFSPTGLNGPTSVLVTLRVTDSSGASTFDTATVVVTNSPPTALAGGPYTVAEGGSTTLTGTGSDLSGAISLDWDLDGDGSFGETGGAATRGDEIGNSPSYSAVGLDGPTVRTVTVRATDNDGDFTTATALVSVTNVAPAVDAGGPYAVSAGGSVALAGVGGPTFSDPGQPDSHTVVWDLDGDGIFGETGGAAGRGNETGLNPTFVANNAFGQVVITLRVTDDDGGTASDTAIVTVAGAQFDFNHDTTPLGPVGTPTPTQAGYTSVLTRDLYTPAKGFGWNAFTSSFDRGALNTTSLPDMRRDGHYGTRNLANTANPTGARTFRADLPNGAYTVNVTMGDPLFAHDNMQIRAEVGEVNQKVLPLISNPLGQYVHTSFTIQVADGHLDLEFSDQGGSNLDWVLNGIEIRPTGIDTIVFDTPADLVTDGITPTTFTATTALAENTLVTITTNVGTIVTPDADPTTPSWTGTQVKVIGGQISFAVVSTANTPVVARAVSVDGMAEGTATANIIVPDLRRYDFNATAPAGGTLDTAVGFTSVTAGSVFTTTAGFGWINNAGIGEFQRSGGAANTSPLRRDANFSSGTVGSTFQMVVTPNVQYNVRVYVGDYAFARSNIAVTVEGASPYIIPPLAAGAFDFRTTTAPISASANGLLTVNIRNTTTSGVWVVNGIEIWKVGTPDPAITMLQAADIATKGSSGATLTSADLAPIVNEAIARWAATGLSPTQIAALQATQIQIVDLGNTTELGNALPGVVQIDDDAAGHGWYVDLTPSDDDEFDLSVAATELQASSGAASGRMDLLTLVMHELGHELGLEDLAVSSAPHNLMTENIATGVRRIPVADQAAGAVPLLFTMSTSARDEVFANLSGPTSSSSKPQAAPTSSLPSALSTFFASSRVSRPSARQKPATEQPKQD